MRVPAVEATRFEVCAPSYAQRRRSVTGSPIRVARAGACPAAHTLAARRGGSRPPARVAVRATERVDRGVSRVAETSPLFPRPTGVSEGGGPAIDTRISYAALRPGCSRVGRSKASQREPEAVPRARRSAQCAAERFPPTSCWIR